MKNNLWNIGKFIVAIAFLGIMALSLTHNASAAPQTTGGTFVVSTYEDDNSPAYDGLTLREAILIANGGTGADGLDRHINDQEKAQLQGCTFDGAINNWTITGGCGKGFTDTIQFNIPSVHPIKWATTPPAVTEPTIIDAFSQPGAHANTAKKGDNAVRKILLDANNSYGFYLKGGYSTIRGFEITHFMTGIYVTDVGNNHIEGNFIHGADLSSTGVQLHWGSFNVVGGVTPAARNVLSDANYGMRVEQWSSFNQVQGNLIGTDLSGRHALGNTVMGIELTNTTFNLIGGETASAGNVIAFNAGQGIRVEYASSGNNIRHNSIFSNGTLGVDLGADGVTANDDQTAPPDADAGPNGFQNYPELTAADSATRTIKGRLFSKPHAQFTLEFFSGPSCDGSSHGDGKTFLYQKLVKTDQNGFVKFSVSFRKKFKAGSAITATATDPDGNTSEFSECKTAK